MEQATNIGMDEDVDARDLSLFQYHYIGMLNVRYRELAGDHDGLSAEWAEFRDRAKELRDRVATTTDAEVDELWKWKHRIDHKEDGEPDLEVTRQAQEDVNEFFHGPGIRTHAQVMAKKRAKQAAEQRNAAGA